jgi:hypothetical protein
MTEQAIWPVAKERLRFEQQVVYHGPESCLIHPLA